MNDNEYHPPRPAHQFDADVAVGRAMRQHRIALGLSEAALATRLGLSIQEYRSIELGDVRMQARALAEFATVTGLPLDRLFENVPIEALNHQLPIAKRDSDKPS